MTDTENPNNELKIAAEKIVSSYRMGTKFRRVIISCFAETSLLSKVFIFADLLWL